MHAEQALTVQNTLEQVETEGAQASQSSQAALEQIEVGNSDTENLRKTLEALSQVEAVLSELSASSIFKVFILGAVAIGNCVRQRTIPSCSKF